MSITMRDLPQHEERSLVTRETARVPSSILGRAAALLYAVIWRYVRQTRKRVARGQKRVGALVKHRGPRPLQKVFVRAQRIGPAYGLLYGGWTLATAATTLATAATQRLADRLRTMEGDRGVLGPFLRDYSDNTVGANRRVWTAWDWSRRGEEWNQSEEWKQSLIDEVLRPYMPYQGRIIEIGPGGGRWSEALLEHARQLILVDVTERALEVCRERFGDVPTLKYVLTSGTDVPGIADADVDAVWSFDVFVHIAPRDIDEYLREIRRVLAPGGVAVIHHHGRASKKGPDGWRSPMTARLFASLAIKHGFILERQFDTWGNGFGVRRHAPPPEGEQRPPENRDLISVLRAPES